MIVGVSSCRYFDIFKDEESTINENYDNIYYVYLILSTYRTSKAIMFLRSDVFIIKLQYRYFYFYMVNLRPEGLILATPPGYATESTPVCRVRYYYTLYYLYV